MIIRTVVMLLGHFQLLHFGIQKGPNNHNEIRGPPKEGLGFAVDDCGHQGLSASFSGARDVVGQWRGYLYLQGCYEADGEATESPDEHDRVEPELSYVLIVGED